MSFLRRFLPIVSFGWDSRRKHVIFVIVVFGLAAIAALSFADEASESRWAIGDRVATMVTLAVAIAVWFGEVREEWERRLPRKLFAFFLFEDQPVAVCLGAALSGEHDARQLGQQIGAQMYSEPRKNLIFDITRIEQRELRIVIPHVGGREAFKPILIVFRLTSKDQVAELGLDPGTTLLWVAGHAERMKVQKTDPRCQLPKDRLSDTVISAVQ